MWRKLRFGVALLAVLASSSRSLRAGDSLQHLRDEARIADPESPRSARSEPAPTPPSRRSNQHDTLPHHGWDEEEQSEDNSVLWGSLLVGVGVVLTSPYWGPQLLIEEEAAQNFYFAPAPYVESPGAMIFQGDGALEPPPQSYAWATRLRTEYLDDLDRLRGYRGHLLVEHVSRFGFDAELNAWHESLPFGASDHLWTGDANVMYRFAQNERVQLRSGIGLAWLADDEQLDLGFNFTYGGDFYPIRPLVVSAELDAGWVGEAWLLHLRSTVGVVYRQVEVYTGYDYLEIGDAQVDGLVAGIRVLF